MPCLIALFALIGPRIALIFTAIFSDMISRAIDSFVVVAFLGFLLLPWTTLAYVVFYDVGSGRAGHRLRVVPRRPRVPVRHLLVRRRALGARSALERRASRRRRLALLAIVQARPERPALTRRRRPQRGRRRGQRERRAARCSGSAGTPSAPAAARGRPRQCAERARPQMRDRVLDLSMHSYFHGARRRTRRSASSAAARCGRPSSTVAQLAPAARCRSRTPCGSPRR